MTDPTERDDLGWLVTSDPDDARAAIDDAILDAANMLDTLGRGVVALVSIGAADPMFDAGRVEATAQRARDAVASITAHVEAEVARRLAAAPGVEVELDSLRPHLTGGATLDYIRAAIAAARHPWVFALDADERIPPSLAAELAAVLACSDRRFLPEKYRASDRGELTAAYNHARRSVRS